MSQAETPEALARVLDMLPPLLADFLATDVRRDPARCDELLAGIAQARTGTPFEAFGNVYELNVAPERAILRTNEEPTFEEMHVSLDALVNVLTAWRTAVVQVSGGVETAIAKSCSASDQPA